MVEAGGDLDLAQEPVGADVRSQLRVQDLDRYRTAVLEILGQIDRGHAAPPDFPLKAVSAGQRALQALQKVRHRCSGCE